MPVFNSTNIFINTTGVSFCLYSELIKYRDREAFDLQLKLSGQQNANVVNKFLYLLTNTEIMTAAKLIHTTPASYLPTAFPVHYYGMPDGKVYLLFSRFYRKEGGGSGVEFVFAVHKDFGFDYKNEVVIAKGKPEKNQVFAELLDNDHIHYEIVKIMRNLNSYGEAVKQLSNLTSEVIVIPAAISNTGQISA